MAPCALNPYYNFNFWAKQTVEPNDDMVELTVFMPNGILLILQTSWNATLAEVKEVRVRNGVVDPSWFQQFKVFLCTFRKYGKKPSENHYLGTSRRPASTCSGWSQNTQVTNCTMRRNAFATFNPTFACSASRTSKFPSTISCKRASIASSENP